MRISLCSRDVGFDPRQAGKTTILPVGTTEVVYEVHDPSGVFRRCPIPAQGPEMVNVLRRAGYAVVRQEDVLAWGRAAAEAINAVASAEVAANRLPPPCRKAASVCDDDGLVEPNRAILVGDVHVAVDIERWRENTRTYSDEGRRAIAAEAAAEERVVAAAQQQGLTTRSGDGAGGYGPIHSYRVECPLIDRTQAALRAMSCDSERDQVPGRSVGIGR